MSFSKKVLLMGTLSSIPFSPQESRIDSLGKFYNNQLMENLEDRGYLETNVPEEFSNSKEADFLFPPCEGGETQITQREGKESINTGIVTVSLSELEGSPIWGSKSIIPAKMEHLLGRYQSTPTLNAYNGKRLQVSANLSPIALNLSEIRFPLIYPELEAYFPLELDVLLRQPPFNKYHGQIKTKNILIVSQCENGKSALAYYQNRKLMMATYVSLGISGHKTRGGIHIIKHDNQFRKSKKYGNAPMPYALHYSGGYFLHQGLSDGRPRSHGCIRVPGLYQRWLYHYLPREGGDTQIILDGMYKPTLKKIVL